MSNSALSILDLFWGDDTTSTSTENVQSSNTTIINTDKNPSSTAATKQNEKSEKQNEAVRKEERSHSAKSLERKASSAVSSQKKTNNYDLSVEEMLDELSEEKHSSQTKAKPLESQKPKEKAKVETKKRVEPITDTKTKKKKEKKKIVASTNQLHTLPTTWHELFPVNDFICEQQIPVVSHPLEDNFLKYVRYSSLTYLTQVKRALDINKSTIHHRTNQYIASAFPITASTVVDIKEDHSITKLYKEQPLSYFHMLDCFEFENTWWIIHSKGSHMHQVTITCAETTNRSPDGIKEMVSQYTHLDEDTNLIPILQITCRKSPMQVDRTTFACRYANNSIGIFEFKIKKGEFKIERIQLIRFESSKVVHIAWQHYTKWKMFQLAIFLSDNTINLWDNIKGYRKTYPEHCISDIPTLPLGGLFHKTICEFTANPFELFIVGNCGIHIYDMRERKSKQLLDMSSITAFARNQHHPYMYAISTQKRVLVFDERMGPQELVCFNLSAEHEGLSEMFFYNFENGNMLLIGYKYQRGITVFPIETSHIVTTMDGTPSKPTLPWDALDSKTFTTRSSGSGIPSELDTFQDATVLVAPNMKLFESTPHYLVGCTLVPPTIQFPFFKIFHASDSGDVFCQCFTVKTAPISFKDRPYEIKDTTLVQSANKFEKLYRWNRKNFPHIFENNAYCEIYSHLAFNTPLETYREPSEKTQTIDATKLAKLMTSEQDTNLSITLSNGFGSQKIPTPEETKQIINVIREKYAACQFFMVFPLVDLHKELITHHGFSYSLSLKVLDRLLTSSNCFTRWKTGTHDQIFSDVYFALTDDEERKIKSELLHKKQHQQEASKNILDILFEDNEMETGPSSSQTSQTSAPLASQSSQSSQQSILYSQNNEDEEKDSEDEDNMKDDTQQDSTTKTTDDILATLFGNDKERDDDSTGSDSDEETEGTRDESRAGLMERLRREVGLDGPFEKDDDGQVKYEQVTVNMDLFRMDLAKWYNKR